MAVAVTGEAAQANSKNVAALLVVEPGLSLEMKETPGMT